MTLEDTCRMMQICQDTFGFIVCGSMVPLPMGRVLKGTRYLFLPLNLHCRVTPIVIIGQASEEDARKQDTLMGWPHRELCPFLYKCVAE